jgi:HD-like signal output (HDOD) protein
MMPSLLRLTELVASEDFTLEQVEKLIQFDQILTVEVLRLANSADAVGQKRVGSVREAVLRLGGERISRYLFSRWLSGSVKIPLRNYGIDPARFWAHGVVVALACDILESNAEPSPPGVLFTAGLLHDMGKIVLDHFANRIGCSIDWSQVLDDEQLIAAEREFFGKTHEEVTVAMMRRWNFPDQVIRACTAIEVNSHLGILHRQAHAIDAWIMDPSLALPVPEAVAQRILKEYNDVKVSMGLD